MTKTLALSPITVEAFQAFGTVVTIENAEIRLINSGTTQRFHALAKADTETQDGGTIISLFRGQPREFPYEVTMMERHPLGSQAFFPLSGLPWVAIVAPDDDGRPGAPQAFLVPGNVGVQYARNIWHHPLIAIDTECDFLVIDREGPGVNLEEADYPVLYLLQAP